MRIAVALVFALGVSGCGSNPDEVALEDACTSLVNADWAALDAATDEISLEYEEEVSLDDFHAVIDGSRAEEFAFDDTITPELKLMGREGAMNHVRGGFEGAWETCAQKFDDTPPANGEEFNAAWDDLGAGLFYLFGAE